jgi:hypothetical protein
MRNKQRHKRYNNGGKEGKGRPEQCVRGKKVIYQVIRFTIGCVHPLSTLVHPGKQKNKKRMGRGGVRIQGAGSKWFSM